MVSEDPHNLAKLCRFGEEFPNKGWVECKSTTFPGKVYYFNANSGCSTWTRPLPENVPLPRHDPKRLRNDSNTSPTHSELAVSDDGKRILDDEFAFRISLFYNIPLDEVQNHMSDLDSDDYTDRMLISDQSDDSEDSSIIVPEELEPQIIYDYPENNSKPFRQLEKLLKESSKSDEDDLYYSERPHMKALDLFDLDLTGKQRKPRRAIVRKPKKSSSSSEPSIEGGMVYHMYGTKTINYDWEEYKKLKKIEDVPEEARTFPRRLSDSSSSSSSSSTCSRGSKCSRLSCKSNKSKNSDVKLNKNEVLKLKSFCLSEESDSS